LKESRFANYQIIFSTISTFEDIKDTTSNKISKIRVFRYLRNTSEDFIGKMKDKILSGRRYDMKAYFLYWQLFP